MKKQIGLVLLMVLLFIMVGCSATTANLTNAHMTTAVDENGVAIDTVESYTTDAVEFMVVAELNNAPANTIVTFVWTYVTENEYITEAVVDSGDEGSEINLYSNLTLGSAWPVGEYKVDIYIDEKEEPDSTVSFTVN
ncbi:MAG: hypothetical protein ACOWWH_06850 [Eubacteriaceae bacterium]